MRRWTILIGRCGTVLLSIGLALLLVSLIPPAQTGMTTSQVSFVYPKSWFFGRYLGVLTPQQSLHIRVGANGTVNAYMFEVSPQTILDWIDEHYHDGVDVFNVTYLNEYLNANPESVGWQAEIQNRTIENDYVPTKVTNATMAVSNPSTDVVQVEYAVSMATVKAPTAKVQTLAQLTIPIGLVLALPWLIDSWRTRAKRRGSQLRN